MIEWAALLAARPPSKQLDHAQPRPYMRASFPGRLTVRLRTLTPSIEVRILTGEPDIPATKLKYNVYYFKIKLRYHIYADTI